MPHGVLFRGGKEGIIRKNLIERHKIDAVIGLPDKLFFNTGIPLCILGLQADNQGGVIFINAEKEYQNMGKQNTIPEKAIKRITEAYIKREEIDKFSHIADLRELEYNDYNMNIPRYVSTYEPEPVPDLTECVMDIADNTRTIRELEKRMLADMESLTATDCQTANTLKKACKILRGAIYGN